MQVLSILLNQLLTCRLFLPIVLSLVRASVASLQSTLEHQFPALDPRVVLSSHGFHLQWAAPSSTHVSVIIPTRDHLTLLHACLQSLRQHASGCSFEIIVVDNGSVREDTISFLEAFQAEPGQFVLRDNGPFNYSSLNNKAAASKGSVLLLLNNDVEILTPNWALSPLPMRLGPA